MKSVLISIQPKWCEKIVDRSKTIEVRKSAPKCDVPFKCYIYCTKSKNKWALSDYEGAYENSDGVFVYAQQHIIGEFMCDKVFQWNCKKYLECDGTVIYRYFPLKPDLDKSCLTFGQFHDYGCGKTLYGWHISDLKIYDKPRELVEFYKCGAKSFEELSDTEDLCQYCSDTDYGEHKYDISSRWGMVSCEGCWCDEAYQTYLDENFALTRAPSNWCYVEEL